jgi:hypothetical protein
MREVFVPGGLPHHTYVAREGFRLEERLRSVTDNLCKLVTITGPTKSGKSVLTQRVFPRNEAVWIDGGAVSTGDEIWSEIVSQMGGFTRHSNVHESGTTAGIQAEAKAQLKLPFFASAEGGLMPSFATSRTSGAGMERDDTSKGVAVRLLRESKRPLVIDDFHYLGRGQQGEVVRALKGLIFDGCPVIVLAIPHRRFDSVRVEKEMTGRVEQIQIPAWERGELEGIPTVGFRLLNAIVQPSIANQFSDEALGSPHLMQDFCRHFCEASSVEESFDSPTPVGDDLNLLHLFRLVSQSTSKAVFDRLSRGPRQRTDRKQHRFVDGTTGDIYVAVLRAISLTKPGMASIQYEDLRSKLREILAGEAPGMSQVSRVIDKMAGISATDESSVPVLDWDKEEQK